MASSGGSTFGSGFAKAGAASAGFAGVASKGTGGGFGGAAVSEAPAPAKGATFGAPASDSDEAEPEDAPTPVEAAANGEEDYSCLHRVRAKLFRLEARCASPTKQPAAPGGESGAESGDKPAAVAASPSAQPAAAAATSPAAKADHDGGKEGSAGLNPNAAPFVPASGASNEDGDGGTQPSAATDAAEPATRWVERGVGSIRVLVPKEAGAAHGSKGSKGSAAGDGDGAAAADGDGDGGADAFPRLVMRVEHVGRLILNELLRPSTAPAERVTDTSIRLVVVGAGGVPQSYLLRVKTPVESEQLMHWINATIPT